MRGPTQALCLGAFVALVGCGPIGEGSRETSGAEVLGELQCGRTTSVRVERLNFFDSWGSGDVRGTQRFVSAEDQMVTFQAVADYDSDFGMRMQAWDGAGHESSYARGYGRTAEVRLWADANATIKVLTWPFSNQERDGTDLHNGQWVDRYKEPYGTYRVTVSCGGATTCEAPEGPGACMRTARCTTGVQVTHLCPGPDDVQCCVTPRTVEPSPPDADADPPADEGSAAPACCDDPADGCRWLGDGVCDEGCAFGYDRDCDGEDDPASDDAGACDGAGGWCDCDGYEDCCDFCW